LNISRQLDHDKLEALESNIVKRPLGKKGKALIKKKKKVKAAVID
jgi:hypothetical protein